MSSVCKSAVGCVVDSRLPLRSSYVNLYKWAESDAEFVRSVATAGAGSAPFPNSRAVMEPSHRLVDSYSSRQMYLRSYTFSKKETMPEKTVKCFGKVKEKATDFPFLHHQRKDSGGSFSSFITCRSCNKKKKGCSVFYTIFRRLLTCTMSVDVAEAD
ncbi:uncharacterized protein LOC110111311 [Dendrobium catenatum]|uniref:Uncharacterized protein n=1 Tax=Dendrobium catenatum TaxID=906689 RepID=A0A2I0WTE6_9ASPA|nr:uncharacterized protein LOC110111311 [Dendrobium catenatum]PKU78913.1 hypothetical protein MA16_Dca000257 [Dendrobium catenatum]